jgi:hypothetical protein
MKKEETRMDEEQWIALEFKVIHTLSRIYKKQVKP